MHQSPHQPKTLFATHYHELNELEEKFDRIKNYHITNKEAGNKIIFLRKLARGGSTHSFGIHVAKMAGMPASLIKRANEILEQLETQHVDEDGSWRSEDGSREKSGSPEVRKSESETFGRYLTDLSEKVKDLNAPQFQLSIFDAHSQTFDEIRRLLADIDINRLTPVEALLKLQEIKGMVK